MEIVQRSVWKCDRDLDGRKNTCLFRCHKNQFSKKRLLNGKKEFTPHWFLVVSKNPTQNFVTALPISSQEYQIDLNGAEKINDGDIADSPNSTKSFPFVKDTYVLCGKPCRIPIEDFTDKENYGRLKKEVYEDIIFWVKALIQPN